MEFKILFSLTEVETAFNRIKDFLISQNFEVESFPEHVTVRKSKNHPHYEIGNKLVLVATKVEDLYNFANGVAVQAGKKTLDTLIR